MRWNQARIVTLTAMLALILFTPASAQTPALEWASNVIVPHCYQPSIARNQIQVTGVKATVQVTEGHAETKLVIDVANQGSRDQTAELLIPVPAGAIVKSLRFSGSNEVSDTQLLEHEQARATFDAIVRKLKDPALLEFAGLNLIRSSVFPVAAGGTQQLEIIYEQLLTRVGNRVEFTLPRSGSVRYSTPWQVTVSITDKDNITAVYSPSHALETTDVNSTNVITKLTEQAARNPGAFQLSYLIDSGEGMGSSFFAYPDADGKGGYFLMLAALGQRDKSDEARESRLRREITLVIDRSGSMEGEKIEQARRAARQVIAGLEHGEAFNIITYNDDIEFYADKPVVKSRTTAVDARKYIDSIIARGGTNLHDALKTALQPEPDAERLPIVLFLTDGLPTVGEVNEHAIRALAKDQNPHEKRIFTFGVGVDVNTPLLDKLATSTRAFATFVLPGQDVETSVSKVFRGLDGPSLASPLLNVLNRRGRNAPSRVSDVLPSTLPDMYEGDQMVILGRYRGNKPLVFRITGNYYGEEKTFERIFSPRQAAKSNRPTDFVARLWASRKIAQLIDTIRDMGGEQMTSTPGNDASTFTNASATATETRLKELTDEIVRLSTEFGILTEYTSFLATQGIDMSNEEQVSAAALENLKIRAFACRSGQGSVNQELNNSLQRNQMWCNTGNAYWNENMQQSSIVTVQQCNTRSLYRRGDRWISNELVAEEGAIEPDRTVEFGSDEFLQLLWQMVAANRNSEMALEGDILLTVDDETILIKAPPQPESENEANSQSDKSSDR